MAAAVPYKESSQACKVIRGCLVETLSRVVCRAAVLLLPCGFEGCSRPGSSCVPPVARKLNCHFIVAAFHTSELTGFWRDGQTQSCTEFSEVDMKSKAQLCWSLIMQLRSPEFLFPKWYAVTVSRLTLRKCMCLVSEKLPDRNHKYLRWSGRNGLLKP